MCLIVIASFTVFAVDQTKAASGHQQEQVDGLSPSTASPTQGASGGSAAAKPHESVVHEAVDEAASALTSPFSGLVSGSDSEWAIRGGKLLVALLVYGFGLGYLAREIGVHA
jgi:hypothetical protein